MSIQMDNFIASTAFAAITLLVLKARRTISRKETPCNETKTITIEDLDHSIIRMLRLLPAEGNSMINAPSVSTVTFYNGKISKDSLQCKVLQIVCENPWLRARLKQSTE